MLISAFSTHSLYRDFNSKWCSCLLGEFSVSILLMMWFISLTMFMCDITLADLLILNQSQILGLIQFVLVHSTLNVFLNLVYMNVIENFVVFVHYHNWSISFFVTVSGLGTYTKLCGSIWRRNSNVNTSHFLFSNTKRHEQK